MAEGNLPKVEKNRMNKYFGRVDGPTYLKRDLPTTDILYPGVRMGEEKF